MTASYPNESPEYRTKRKTLLAAEIALRSQVEDVAKLRRGLPPGGRLAENYQFFRTDGSGVRIKELLSAEKSSLAVYSLMFADNDTAACPMCCSLLDGINAQARDIGRHMTLVVVAAAAPDKLAKLAQGRGWTALTLLSAQGTSYQRDYLAETPEGSQLPVLNIFKRDGDDIHHFWGTELLFEKLDGHPRHLDQLWPLWNMLDLTPAGRGDWTPAP